MIKHTEREREREERERTRAGGPNPNKDGSEFKGLLMLEALLDLNFKGHRTYPARLSGEASCSPGNGVPENMWGDDTGHSGKMTP